MEKIEKLAKLMKDFLNEQDDTHENEVYETPYVTAKDVLENFLEFLYKPNEELQTQQKELSEKWKELNELIESQKEKILDLLKD